MLGAVIGDIVGSAYEFNPVRTQDFKPFVPGRSFFTDDSVLTFATAEILMDGGDYAEAYRRWGTDYPGRGYGGRFAFWLRGGITGAYNSLGNGSAMRVAPVGWAYETLDETLEEAKRSAECTHNHPEGIKGAQATAAAIFWARQGRDKAFIRENLEKRFEYDLSRSFEQVWETSEFDETCPVSVPEALIAFLEADNFEQTIRYAVSLGADADTQACIAGGIAEAFWKSIPQDWIDAALEILDDPTRKVLTRFREKYVLSDPLKDEWKKNKDVAF